MSETYAPNTPALPDDLSAALDRLAGALAAIASGDPAPYAAMWAERDDVTLFGAWGPMELGHHDVTTTFQWVGRRFSDGALVPRHDVVAWSGDLAYTVGVEDGVVRVDGGPSQPMRLRVTHVLRRVGGEWQLVHRHADFPPADQRNTTSSTAADRASRLQADAKRPPTGRGDRTSTDPCTTRGRPLP